MQKPIKVAIIEDLKEVALELKTMFNEQEDIICNYVYFTAEDAMCFLPNADIDVVIVDIGLPGVTGIDAIIALRKKMIKAQFCMFTVFEDDDKIYNSLKAGAKGYILKNSSPSKIINSVRELHNGGSPMNPNIARKIIDAFSSLEIKNRNIRAELPLTKREYEILKELSKGLLYKEISEKMQITIGTVKQHIHKIYDKLHVSNRTEAINRLFKR